VNKQIRMLELILHFHERARRIVRLGAPIAVIHNLPAVNTLIRMKTVVPNEDLSRLKEIRIEIDEQMEKLEVDYL
jgi:vacuolar-type H+-ATPase catalytic subunit A/Vma1